MSNPAAIDAWTTISQGTSTAPLASFYHDSESNFSLPPSENLAANLLDHTRAVSGFASIGGVYSNYYDEWLPMFDFAEAPQPSTSPPSQPTPS
jgi:hypothetical protein